MKRRLSFFLTVAAAIAVASLFAACEAEDAESPSTATPVVASSTHSPTVTEGQPTAPPTEAAPAATPTSGTPLTVSSDDGSAELDIPPGALPEGVDPSQIRIDRLSAEDEGVLVNEKAPIAAYDLQPDGTEFRTPVRLTLVQPYEGNVSPLVALVSEDELEFVPVVEFRREELSGPAVIGIELTHFSRLIITHNSIFEAQLESIRDQLVGDSFTVTGRLVKVRNESSVAAFGSDGRIVDRFQVAESWSLVGRFESEGGVLAPEQILDAPPRTSTTDDLFTTRGTFTCMSPGAGTVYLAGEISWASSSTISYYREDGSEIGTPTPRDEGKSYIRTDLLYVYSTVNCLPPPTPTPTPTSTALEWFANLFVDTPECTADPTGDNDMLSDPSWTAKPVDWTDIECSSAWIADGASVSTWFEEGGLLECGATGFAEEASEVICSDNVLPMENGPVLISRMDLAAPPPAGPNSGATFTYAFVADSDGDPDNNFKFQGSFALDLFQGTDMWYTLGNDPQSGKIYLSTLDVRGGGFNQFDTAARAIIVGPSVIFVIPLKELGGNPDMLGVRQTAFSFDADQPIDGTGSMDTAGADGPEFVDVPLLAPPLGPDLFAEPGPRNR